MIGLEIIVTIYLYYSCVLFGRSDNRVAAEGTFD